MDGSSAWFPLPGPDPGHRQQQQGGGDTPQRHPSATHTQGACGNGAARSIGQWSNGGENPDLRNNNRRARGKAPIFSPPSGGGGKATPKVKESCLESPRSSSHTTRNSDAIRGACECSNPVYTRLWTGRGPTHTLGHGATNRCNLRQENGECVMLCSQGSSRRAG